MSKRKIKLSSGAQARENKDFKALAMQVQSDLKAGACQTALDAARELEALLAPGAEHADVYLASLVWQVRALQGLQADAEDTARRYAAEAERLGDFARAVQGHRIIAQAYIDAGRWTVASDALEKALNLAISHNIGRQALEILMHLSAVELKMSHYVEAAEYLSRAMHAVGQMEEFRDIRATGHRQLCELYDKTGDGQNACDALEAALSAHTDDAEEVWLIGVMQSRFEMRSGDADSACVRLRKIESEIRKAVAAGTARDAQLRMVGLERAQAMWNHGENAAAEAKIAEIREGAGDAVRQACALTEFLWAVEKGQPGADPDEACRVFSEISAGMENTEIEIALAAALGQAGLEIARGHFEPTLESLLHIAQTAAFTQLIPFATRALLLRGEISEAQGDFAAAAQDGRDACETFVAHVDDVSAKCAACLMLRAQFAGALKTDSAAVLDDAERKAFAQLLADLERYDSHHHIEGVLDLGLGLAKIAEMTGDRDLEAQLLDRVGAALEGRQMAFRQMRYAQLRGRLAGDDAMLARAKAIALQNGYAL
ncbi:MAG: hypothetical protein IKY83_08665 [Proteobacteria bacterium]|nr:hypothetical protein [Pseudomonadota bacterium]